VVRKWPLTVDSRRGAKVEVTLTIRLRREEGRGAGGGTSGRVGKEELEEEVEWSAPAAVAAADGAF
jgi:hypothetical protein